MRRVLHLIGTLEKAGGAQRILLEVLRRVDRARFASEVAVLHGANELTAEMAAIGVPVHDLRRHSLLDPIGVRATRRLIAEKRYDVVHCHLSRAEIVGGLALRTVAGPRLLLHKHNDDAWWRKPHLAAIHRVLVRRADAIVCVSDAVAAHFSALDANARPKLVRVYNGVDVAALAAAAGDRDATRASLGLAADATLIVSVGRLVPQKGFDVLVEALADPALANATAVIVGRGEELPRLEARAKAKGLESRVRFAGVRSDVPAVMHAADVVAAPSRWEGFGIVIAEAMAMSRPVVASRVSAIPELVVDGETGRLVPPESAPSLAAALAELLADPARATAMGRAGHARASAMFDLSKTVLAWESLWS